MAADDPFLVRELSAEIASTSGDIEPDFAVRRPDRNRVSTDFRPQTAVDVPNGDGTLDVGSEIPLRGPQTQELPRPGLLRRQSRRRDAPYGDKEHRDERRALGDDGRRRPWDNGRRRPRDNGRRTVPISQTAHRASRSAFSSSHSRIGSLLDVTFRRNQSQAPPRSPDFNARMISTCSRLADSMTRRSRANARP